MGSDLLDFELASIPDLSLNDIILLDKVAKGKNIEKEEAKYLKGKGWIEGRKPNYHISSEVAKATGEKTKYIKQRGIKDKHYKQMIIEYIRKYGHASKKDIDSLLLDILPSVLDVKQKSNKVKNIVYAMSKKDCSIINKGTKRYPKWKLSLSKTAIKENHLDKL